MQEISPESTAEIADTLPVKTSKRPSKKTPRTEPEVQVPEVLQADTHLEGAESLPAAADVELPQPEKKGRTSRKKKAEQEAPRIEISSAPAADLQPLDPEVLAGVPERQAEQDEVTPEHFTEVVISAPEHAAAAIAADVAQSSIPTEDLQDKKAGSKRKKKAQSTEAQVSAVVELQPEMVVLEAPAKQPAEPVAIDTPPDPPRKGRGSRKKTEQPSEEVQNPEPVAAESMETTASETVIPETAADAPATVEATPETAAEVAPEGVQVDAQPAKTSKPRKGRKTTQAADDTQQAEKVSTSEMASAQSVVTPEIDPEPAQTEPEVQATEPVGVEPAATETVAAEEAAPKARKSRKKNAPAVPDQALTQTEAVQVTPVVSEPEQNSEPVQPAEVQATESTPAEAVPAQKGRKTRKAAPVEAAAAPVAPEVAEISPTEARPAENTPVEVAAAVEPVSEQVVENAPRTSSRRKKTAAEPVIQETSVEAAPAPDISTEQAPDADVQEVLESVPVQAPVKKKGRGKKQAAPEVVVPEEPTQEPLKLDDALEDSAEVVDLVEEGGQEDVPQPSIRTLEHGDSTPETAPSKPSIPTPQSSPASPDLPAYLYVKRDKQPTSKAAPRSQQPQQKAPEKGPSRGKGQQNQQQTPEPQKLDPAELANKDPKEVLLEFMKQKRRTWHVRDLERALPRVVKNNLGNRRNMESLLEELAEEDKVVRVRRRVYAYPEDTNLVRGRFQSSSSGFGFVIPETGKEDYFIPADATLGAWTGDIVQIKAEEKRKNENSPRGVVVRIVERGNAQLIGTLEERKGNQVLIPDDTRLARSIPLLSEGLENVALGSRLVAELHWPENTREPYARVKEVLGTEITPETETRAVIAQYDLRDEFPIEVEKESEKISTRITKKMLEGRLDLREKNIFTVDGRDAKDFDDAIHIERLENGNFLLGIHIADVSYYVTEGSALDKEAYQRATSVYLPGKVLPMLPEKLSNGVCSLVPHKDRLTLSALVEMGPDMDILTYSVTPSVIHSKARLTYDEVQAYSEGTASLPDHARHLEGDMHLLLKITNKMRQRRLREGSLDFKLSEVKVEVDKEGRLELIPIREETARGMIEDLMLLANKVVAQYMIEHHIPALYRVHEDPSDDRWTELRHMLTKMGLQADEKPTPQNYQALLKQVRGTPKETVVNHLLLRSLKQAKYAQHNLGHFGLAFSEYLHFTSPIRRYPDLLVHRMLRKHLQQEISGPEKERIHDKLAGMGDHTSERERAASDAERELTKYYQCLWAQGQLGEVFDGHISSVTSFGFFVSIQNGIEGLVHISSLPDYYIFFEDTMSLKGKNNGQSFQLGDKLQVQISNVNLAARQIDFILWENDMDQKPRARKRGETQNNGSNTNQNTNNRKPTPQQARGNAGGQGGQGGRKRRVVTLERSKNEYSRPVNVTVQKLYFGDWTVENLRDDEPQQPRRDFRGGGGNNRPPQNKQQNQSQNRGKGQQGNPGQQQKGQDRAPQQAREGGNRNSGRDQQERRDQTRDQNRDQNRDQGREQQKAQQQNRDQGRNQGRNRGESPIPMQKPRPQKPMQLPRNPDRNASRPSEGKGERSVPQPQQYQPSEPREAQPQVKADPAQQTRTEGNAQKNDAQKRRRRKPKTNGKGNDSSGEE
ncbi:hypothetical protein DC3_09860 [Deinococcus cellulosilyticus NBRC 106333 = KACC 11606]|uniref:Ribonuclease R n=1 Tax=Deinococcus cellulosilyticus (strain DSM 18568 / NBRC 106333 / KACC 11606 / 5516J-15) TaxID=1223518 RepID=A0A511MYC2_DEIC1|nr:hypothetical protein DC3_09860 [Deinococcus cellulosilyticus NBRC 106333 = KACC 11606]